MELDTSLVDEAISFATKAHEGTARKGKGFPYIVHPLEAISIVATMSDDPEMLAAAALHDVVEDTDCTIADIREHFGDRVARLVHNETQVIPEGRSEMDSWHERRSCAIARIAAADHDSKIVALGDKLSNIRAIARDYHEQGDSLWSLFHATDPRDHEWYYRGLVSSLSELAGTSAYEEFAHLVDEVFLQACAEFSYEVDAAAHTIFATGHVDGPAAAALVEQMNTDTTWRLDFLHVGRMSFAGMDRLLAAARDDGLDFFIVNASPEVVHAIEGAGISAFVPTLGRPVTVDLASAEEFGGSFTAASYYTADGDAMFKLYYPGRGMTPEDAQQEKLRATRTLQLGIPTPLVGDLVEAEGRSGVMFERVRNKKSIARAIADEPDRLEELTCLFARKTLELHATPCNTALFPSLKASRLALIDTLPEYAEQDKETIRAFVQALPDETTCLHGDLHVGNMIITPGASPVALWIDMGEFSYGYPLLDLGSVFFSLKVAPDERAYATYHITSQQRSDIWDVFVREYFGATSREAIDAAAEQCAPFAGVEAMLYARLTGSLTTTLRYAIDTYLLHR